MYAPETQRPIRAVVAAEAPVVIAEIKEREMRSQCSRRCDISFCTRRIASQSTTASSSNTASPHTFSGVEFSAIPRSPSCESVNALPVATCRTTFAGSNRVAARHEVSWIGTLCDKTLGICMSFSALWPRRPGGQGQHEHMQLRARQRANHEEVANPRQRVDDVEKRCADNNCVAGWTVAHRHGADATAGKQRRVAARGPLCGCARE